ncbi:MAG: 4-hydroxy-tetrahydrodipicolinate synthase [Ilumatobacteraceae bacterium]
MPHFGRVLTAMVTPMAPDGAIDPDGAARLARWLVDQGNDGLVVAGTTGESPTLSDDEKLALFAAVVDAVDVPVIAGTVGPDTAHSVQLSREAAALGVAGILSLCPYYNRPSQAGIEAHLRAVADATPLPNLVYDIPVRTGRKISDEVLVRVAHDVPNIVGVKDAAANPGATARVVASTPDHFEVYSGDDTMTLPLLAIGAVGTVGVATHWTAPDHVEMFDRWERGDVAGARAVNARMLESFGFETGDAAPNPIPTKVMLRVLGIDAGQCRLPMGPPPAGMDHTAREVIARLEAARAAAGRRPAESEQNEMSRG